MDTPINVALSIVVVSALAVVLALLVARIDERREMRRREKLLSDALARYYSHFWRPSPDTERREG